MNALIAEAEKSKSNRQILCELNSTKTRLHKISEHRTRGTILRSRARWHEEGERNSKYFYNLEKRNYSKKVVTKLKLKDGSFTTNQLDILNEEKEFYQNLYQSLVPPAHNTHDNDTFFNLDSVPTLNEDE